MDDWDLLKEFRERASQEAFAELVHRHSGLVYQACRRQLRDTHLAEDVSQAVFLLLARRGPGVGCPSVAGWLYRTACLACRNAVKARDRFRRRELRAAWQRPGSQDATAVDEGVADLVIASLASADRDVLLMRFYEACDLRHVGQRLGISENAAAKRVARAILRARRLLLDRGIDLATPSVGAALVQSLKGPAPDRVVQLIRLQRPEETSPLVLHIVRGTIHMMHYTKAKVIAAAAGLSVCVGTFAVAGMLSAPPEPPPAKAPEKATMTPKQVLKAFAAAVRRGDGEAIVPLGVTENPDERLLMERTSQYITATGLFRASVREKFGVDAEKEVAALLELTPIGRFALLIETTVDQSPEDVQGDVAIIQPPEIPDLTFCLLNKDGQWRMSTGRMTEHWTPEEWEARVGLITLAGEKMEEWTVAIREGKYASFAELKAVVGPVLRQNR